MASTWLGLDLAGRPDVTEVEHRVLTAVRELALDADHVVTQVLPGDPVPRAVAVLRLHEVADAPERLAGHLDAAVAVLDGSGTDGATRLLGDVPAAAACRDAAAAARDGMSGRCVRFPGQARLTGVVPVRRVVERSAIARVAGSGWAVHADDLLDTRGHLRPTFEAGELVLRVGPAAGGLLVPQEIPDPHRCCAGHA